MATPDLLMVCPECHAWPMAADGPLINGYSGEMLFRCASCRHREIFDLKTPLPQEGFVHRPYDSRDRRWGREWSRPE